jgi:hypothetical protein
MKNIQLTLVFRPTGNQHDYTQYVYLYTTVYWNMPPCAGTHDDDQYTGIQMIILLMHTNTQYINLHAYV